MAAAAGAVGMGLQTAGKLGSTASNVIASDVTAKQLDAKARSIEEQAAFDEQQQRRQNRFMLGEAIAQGASSGVAITSGSPLLHELDRVKQAKMEELNLRAAGTTAASAVRFQSRMVRRQIPWQIAGGVAETAGSILSSYAR